MRDSRRYYEDDRSDKEVFDKFKDDLSNLMSDNGYDLKYSFAHHVAIEYKEGLLEVYEYDRPENPRIENGVLEFDWDLVGEKMVIRIELI